MTLWRNPTVLVFSLFFLVAVVSGPVVSGVDLTPDDRSTGGESSFVQLNGTLTASQATIPSDGYRFESGVSGSGIHKLRAPESTLAVDAVSGTVLVVHSVEIPELGVDAESYRIVDAESPRQLTLAAEETSIASEQLEKSEYAGTVELAVRTDRGVRVVAQEPVTVVVS